MLITTTATIGLLLLLGLTIFQLLLIAGKPLGNFAWGGKHKTLPRNLKVASAFSIVLYLIFAVFLASAAGIADFIKNEQVVTIGMWVFTGYFILGVFMNLISRSKQERLLMTPVALVLAAVFLVVTLAPHPESENVHQGPSFVFDTTNAPGWWSGSNYYPTDDPAGEYQGDPSELPIVTMTISQGTQNAPGECFVMSSYKNGDVDITATLRKREAAMVGEDNLDLLKQVGTTPHTIQTPEGVKEYTLYQYDLNIPQVQRGNEFGFIPLSDGYIEIRGICATADQLSTTLTGLSAIKLSL